MYMNCKLSTAAGYQKRQRAGQDFRGEGEAGGPVVESGDLLLAGAALAGVGLLRGACECRLWAVT